VGGSLKKEPPDADEFLGLIRSGTVRLSDAGNSSLSLESRFDLAYNAAHALSLAALRHRGYRATNRYIVFQALDLTVGIGPGIWRVLAKCHQIRNQSEYEGDLSVDEQLLKDLIAACKAVAEATAKLPPLTHRSRRS
jgi:hypothetical protein